MLQNIKAVIFDVDGTLVDSMWIWRQVDIEFLSRRDIELPDNLQKDIEGVSYTGTAEYFKKRFSLPESVEEIKEEWREMADDFYNNKIALKDGVGEVLTFFKDKGMKLGIATSNSREIVNTMITRHKLKLYFDIIRTSCEVPRSKPYPDVYLQAAKDLSVEPEDCLVFEDTVAGVNAAKAAGMKVIAIYDKLSAEAQEYLKQRADLYIMDYYEFLREITN